VGDELAAERGQGVGGHRPILVPNCCSFKKD
jgi:hypothetical protein